MLIQVGIELAFPDHMTSALFLGPSVSLEVSRGFDSFTLDTGYVSYMLSETLIITIGLTSEILVFEQHYFLPHKYVGLHK